MIKTVKKIILFLLISLNSVLVFSKSYKEYISPEYYSALETEGFVRIIHKNPDEKLVLLPECEYTKEFFNNRIEAVPKLYHFVAENAYLLKKSEILKTSNSTKTDITTDDISIVVRSVSKMEGMTYYSNTRRMNTVLYKKCFMIDDLKTKNRIPDRNMEDPNGKVYYCLQHDRSFGECRYQLNYHVNADTVYCVFKNIDSMGLGPIRAVDPDDMRINIMAQDCEEYILFYIEVELNSINNALIRKQIEASLISRIDAIYNWFFVQF